MFVASIRRGKKLGCRNRRISKMSNERGRKLRRL